MILVIVLILLFICLLLLPFLLANASLDTSKALSLEVKSDNVRDPRYFPKAFIGLMEQALKGYDGSGHIRLSKEEVLLEPPLPTGELDGVVFTREAFSFEGPRSFPKEIYCKADARISAGTDLRAIACLGTLTLEERCQVVRWVDGQHALTVLSGCDLGISATSAEELTLAAGCEFRRLYAPMIQIGAVETILHPPEPIPSKKISRQLRELERQEYIEGDVITFHDLVMGEYAEISGSLKSRKRIHVKRGACIMGNLIADDDLVLEDHVFVGGIVFSQGWVYVGPNCQIGRKGRIKSIVARGGVVLAEGTLVFGYVSGEVSGKTVAAADYYSLIGDMY